MRLDIQGITFVRDTAVFTDCNNERHITNEWWISERTKDICDWRDDADCSMVPIEAWINRWKYKKKDNMQLDSFIQEDGTCF